MISDNLVTAHAHNVINLYGATVNINPVSAPDLVFAETKLDGSFQDAQFSIQGFKKPYRLDISGNSGGMLVFVNESIHSRKPDGIILPSDIQAIPIELKFKEE